MDRSYSLLVAKTHTLGLLTVPLCFFIFIPGIMHEDGAQIGKFLSPIGSPAVSAIYLTEQQVSLEGNGMFFMRLRKQQESAISLHICNKKFLKDSSWH